VLGNALFPLHRNETYPRPCYLSEKGSVCTVEGLSAAMVESIGVEVSETTEFPLVDVVVLNWNLPKDTVECVQSILRSDYPRYRITVVDNGSTDDSVQRLEGQFGDAIHLIVNETNLGFGGGNNQGIQDSLARGADYTLLLNNDTIVAPDMLSELIQIIRSDPQIGIVGPMIYYADRPTDVWFAGMCFKSKLYVVQRNLRLRHPLKRAEEVDFVSGCGMLVNRNVWETVGLFAPEFFMYYEDLDFCLRARQAGFRLITATRAQMWHRISASSGGSDSPMKQYHQVKSSLLFYRKHTRGLWFLINMTLRIGHAGWITLKQIFRGRLSWEVVKWYLRGVAEVILGSDHYESTCRAR
jgi:GT2 family glycosyltransferase